MFGSHFEIQDGCLSLIKITNIILTVAVTETTRQEYVVFTADQQLYRVAVHVMWENQVLFGNIYLRLGDMHLLMSYVG